ncbi:MAG: hypothetical protein KDJ41_12835 [Hyphomicrobiaceae bacterium]|nr:hypothetical protein [Hyphomicrobiaceae bacterium]
MLKKILTVLALTTGAVAIMPADAYAYYCRARSPSAWGAGWHNYDLGYARRRALRECAARTPRHQVCRITFCRRGGPR